MVRNIFLVTDSKHLRLRRPPPPLPPPPQDDIVHALKDSTTLLRNQNTYIKIM